MATKMAEDGKRKKTGGRQQGTKNKPKPEKTAIGEIFKCILGFDPETNQFFAHGLKVRQRFIEMLSGERDVDPAYVKMHAYLMSYAIGLPMRMTKDDALAMARRMAFITARGLPWDQDPLAHRESVMIQQQEAEAALQLEMATKQQVILEAGGTLDASKAQESKDFDLVRPEDMG